MASYETQCGGCTYYDFQGDDYKGYCSWYKCYYYPGDSCSHQNPREQGSSGCYITTIICDVLGFEDDCSVLNNLRSFRDNVMQKNCRYFKLLLEYDVIGPKISQLIKEEYDKTQDKEIWIQFYNFYLVPTSNYVNENKNEDAITRYMEMISSLKEYFSLEDIDLNKIAEDYDMTNGGHGKLKFLERN